MDIVEMCLATVEERMEQVEQEHDREMNVTPGMVKAFQVVTGYALLEDVVYEGITVALFARLLEKKKAVELHPVNLDPYPATVGELAEEFVRVVVDLEESGAARGLVDQVRCRLTDWRARMDDGRAEHESNIINEDAF